MLQVMISRYRMDAHSSAEYWMDSSAWINPANIEHFEEAYDPETGLGNGSIITFTSGKTLKIELNARDLAHAIAALWRPYGSAISARLEGSSQ